MDNRRKLNIKELNRVSIDDFKLLNKIPIVVVLENIRSLINIGSVFRTIDAFKLQAVYLCGISATPPHREITKAALGATESVVWEYFPTTNNAIQRLKSMNYQIIAIEQATNSVFLHNYNIEKDSKYGLIFGNEVNGVEDETLNNCDNCIEIEQFGTKHSLNVSISAGIVIWEFFKKMHY